MDWSKAKNILIIAFIITNIFLIYTLEKDLFIKRDIELISENYISDVENYLMAKGIKLEIPIPREIIPMPTLMVKYKTFDHEQTAQKFLGKNYEKIGDGIYHSEKAILKILSHKRIIYSYKNIEDFNIDIDENRAKEIAEAFLYEYKINTKDLILQKIEHTTVKEYGDSPVFKLIFNQVYGDRFLAESFINIFIKQETVIGLEMMLLEYEKIYSEKKKIIPATDALLRKMSKMLDDNKKNEEIIIISIEAGYYFNPSNMGLQNWQTIVSGTAFPCWRIMLKNGKNYYVEAFKN